MGTMTHRLRWAPRVARVGPRLRRGVPAGRPGRAVRRSCARLGSRGIRRATPAGGSSKVSERSGSKRRSPSKASRHFPDAWRRITDRCARLSSSRSSRRLNQWPSRRSHGVVFQSSARPPPGLSTRAISSRARRPSNQWNAWATQIASALASASGMRSAVPSSARAAGAARVSCSLIAASGSIAITSSKRGIRARVSLPVPAARSTTTDRRSRPSSRMSESIASDGYPDARAHIPARRR